MAANPVAQVTITLEEFSSTEGYIKRQIMLTNVTILQYIGSKKDFLTQIL